MFDTHIDKWELISYADEFGYDTAWVPDSQMIWSDYYATMALAAVNTQRIRIGTSVAITGTRIAPVPPALASRQSFGVLSSIFSYFR
jgi:alkanesulfonate monooxygenase SsuD/methylene tetrahydromethanopterin reductase-like flavin-dependent oxidoreductase (luciferase family)